MHVVNRVVLVMGLIGFRLPALAQEVQGGVDFLIGVPQGEFRRNVDKTGFGIVANVGLAPETIPVMIGIEAGYLNYGSESRREPLSTTIPDVTVDVNTTNNFVLGHAIVRVQPNVGTVRPYLQGLLGMNYLFTKTTIENRALPGQEVASDVNKSDVTFSYGGGVGIMVNVYSGEEEESLRNVLIHAGARYVAGGRAQYLREGSIRREAGNVTYDTLESTTDLLSILIGVSFYF